MAPVDFFSIVAPTLAPTSFILFTGRLLFSPRNKVANYGAQCRRALARQVKQRCEIGNLGLRRACRRVGNKKRTPVL